MQARARRAISVARLRTTSAFHLGSSTMASPTRCASAAAAKCTSFHASLEHGARTPDRARIVPPALRSGGSRPRRRSPFGRPRWLLATGGDGLRPRWRRGCHPRHDPTRACYGGRRTTTSVVGGRGTMVVPVLQCLLAPPHRATPFADCARDQRPALARSQAWLMLGRMGLHKSELCAACRATRQPHHKRPPRTYSRLTHAFARSRLARVRAVLCLRALHGSP